MDSAATLNSIVHSLLEEPALVGDPEWDTFSLLATITTEQTGLSAYRYRDGHPPVATQITDPPYDALRDLQAATAGADDAPWEVCILKVDRDTGKGAVNFVFPDEASIWRIDPTNVATVAENLRPVPADFAS